MSDLAAIILAAGAGKRAGGYKPLWPLGDGLVIDAVIDAARSVCSLVRVVGGAEFETLQRHLEQQHPRVELVRNEAWEHGGMFSSVQLGLAGIDGPAFVHPCDVPGAGPAIYQLLAQAYHSGEDQVVRPVHSGRGGHPVLLSQAIVNAVREAPQSATLREVISGHGRVDVELGDDLACLDFDTREAYQALRARLDPRAPSGERE